MKKILFLLSFWFIGHLNAQVKDPVQWTFISKKINATTYEIHLIAKIEPRWHVYSTTTPNGGPVPTSIHINTNPLITVEGKPIEAGKLEQRYEKLFGVDVKQYSNRVEFIQKIILKKPVKTSISGTIEYMTCNDQECLPPKTEKFSVSLN